VKRAHAYVHDHLQEIISVGEVAKAVGFCADHFGRVFRRSTGETFTEYVARARMKKAKQLLANPHQRIGEVAFDCGFQSISHFDRVFKRLTGQTPKDYRASVTTAESR
jgi:transcriptional regulator GlxA family with amidase domain